MTVLLVGDADVPVHCRRVTEEREHAGGEVGAGDVESVRQVAVDRRPVGSLGGLVSPGGRMIVQSRLLSRIAASALRMSAQTWRRNVPRTTGLSRQRM